MSLKVDSTVHSVLSVVSFLTLFLKLCTRRHPDLSFPKFCPVVCLGCARMTQAESSFFDCKENQRIKYFHISKLVPLLCQLKKNVFP